MTASQNRFQRAFFERLSEKFPSRSDMVVSLGEVLHVGRDAVYRRMRGETVLSADELMLLSETFGVEAMPNGKRPSLPTMSYFQSEDRETSEQTYFIDLRKQSDLFLALPGINVDYASPELLIHYELMFPVLRSFKIFMYGITTWGLHKWKDQRFSSDLIPPATHALIDGIVRDAYRVPGRELWSIGILDVTLRQISYMYQVGRFAHPQDLETIFAELEAILDHLEAMARSGKRFYPGETPNEDSPTFRVYHNELSNTNNTIIIHSNTKNYLFSTLVNPSFLASRDPRILSDVVRWFDNLVEHANSLNAESGKYNTQYFGKLRQQLRATRETIRFGSGIF
ncbi:hypothetical protein QWY85_14670 [Neolewinella lacunae]|uniref:BetR domain-containing protein n=1 Tax=Neolewinella lacunae TaxID=1517758 RepID=A0A923PFE9_9BACT|nr:hypothetical protein [Neolewinella lacunae]MBC6993090.1 hypothetical protein [Neolewinella lacunae]MDN3635910.1 hypothetical protein [Neolewinella lacunae]